MLLDAVDLPAGFSRKIWQKITILENFRRSLHSALAMESAVQDLATDNDVP